MARTKQTQRTNMRQSASTSNDNNHTTTTTTAPVQSSRKRRIEETNEDASVPLHRVEERPAKRKRALPPEDYIDLTLDDAVDEKLQPNASAPATTVQPATEECSICYDNIKDQGKLDSCVHLFCFECIFKWSKQANVCPICKQRFNAIEKVDQATGRPCQLNETERQASAPVTQYTRRRGPASRRQQAANVVNVQQRDFHLTPQDGDFYFPQGPDLFANVFRGLIDRIATFYGNPFAEPNRMPTVPPPPSNPDAPIVIDDNDDDDNDDSNDDSSTDNDNSAEAMMRMYGFDFDDGDTQPISLAMQHHIEAHQRHVQQALQLHHNVHMNAHPLISTTRIVHLSPHQRVQQQPTRNVHVPQQQQQQQPRPSSSRQQPRRR